MMLAYAIDFAQPYMDLGFTVPVGAGACVFIVLMEITSILENACEINPELPEQLKRLLVSQKGGDRND